MARRSGISRAIDDSGRITVPKEIRNNTHIKEGDYLEFHLDEDDNIIIKRTKLNVGKKISNIIEDVKQYSDTEHIVDLLVTAKNKFIEMFGDDNNG